MQADPSTAGRPRARPTSSLASAFVMAGLLYGCALPPPPGATPAQVVSAPPPPTVVAPAAAPAPPPSVTALPSPAPVGADALLAYADRIRGLTAPELTQEINRLSDPQESAPRLLQLAIALGASRTPVNNIRAQSILQRVLAQNHPDAQALHPLARLLLAQFTEARRLEEQLERQNQQVKDGQRRIDHLNERLEALRAIERSLPSRPAAAASSPANGTRP